jgi:hypothetical protein
MLTGGTRNLPERQKTVRATKWAVGQAMTLEETLDFAIARTYESFA